MKCVAWLLAPSNDLYGASQTMIGVARELTRQGVDVHIILPGPGPIAAAVADHGIALHVGPLPVLRRGGLRSNPVIAVSRLLAEAVACRRWLRTLPAPDVVHAFCLPSVGVLLARSIHPGARVGWSIHEVSRGRLERRVFRWLVMLVDYRVACSQFVRESMGFSTEECFVIYSGVSLPQGGEKLSEMETDAALRIICVGRLNSWKGQEVLLAAVALLAREGRDVHLTLVGGAIASDLGIAARLHEIAEAADLQGRVVFAGEVPNAYRLMAQADVVVVPSIRPEPFGKVVVEAMLQGVPVIATEPGGPVEIIEHESSGLLVPAGDCDALAAALGRMFDPVFRLTLATAGYDRAQDFSQTFCDKEYSSILKDQS